MKKKILMILAGIVVLAVIVVAVIVMNLGGLVKMGVEKGGTLILGVPTRLDSASVSLFGGTAGFDGLSLGSPEGFEAPEMFRLGHAHVTVDIGSLRSEEIVVHEVVVDGPEITLEFADGKTNWGVLMARLESEPTEEEEKKASEKKIRIGRIAFSNGRIHVKGIPLAGGASIPLPNLELTDIGSPSGTGATVRNVLADVISSLYKSILGAVRGVVPTEELEKLGEEVQAVLGEAGAAVKDAGATVEEATKGAAEKAKGLLKGVLGGD